MTGDLQPYAPVTVIPPSIPEGLTNEGDLILPGDTTITLPEGNHLFDNLIFTSNSHIHTSGEQTRIWFTNYLRIESNASLESISQIPGHLQLTGTETATAVDLISNSQLVATLNVNGSTALSGDSDRY